MVMPSDEPRRLADGSLDFDFYRRRAVRERARLQRELLKGRAIPLARMLVAVAALVLAICLLPAADGSGWKGDQPNGRVANAPDAAVLPGKF